MSGRILFIFSTKSMLWTGGFAGVGIIINLILSLFGVEIVGYIIIAVLALIGFAIGTLKVPELGFLEFTKKIGGENMDDIIRRAIKFRRKNRKIYVYKEDNTNDR